MPSVAGVRIPSARVFIASALVVVATLWILRNTRIGQNMSSSLKI